MSKKSGKIIIGAGVKNVWPWELHSAQALCNNGYVVTFIPKLDSAHSADAYLDARPYEFKSPEGSNIKNVENNLKKALRNQSKSVVIDTIRLKRVRDRSVLNYLLKLSREQRGLKDLILVTKNGCVIDIYHSKR